jgi:hypothetical protein
MFSLHLGLISKQNKFASSFHLLALFKELFDSHNTGSQIPGELKLVATAVLSHEFGWSAVTYLKKSRAFIWAENVHNVTVQWKDSDPKSMFSAHDTLLLLIFNSLQMIRITSYGRESLLTSNQMVFLQNTTFHPIPYQTTTKCVPHMSHKTFF